MVSFELQSSIYLIGFVLWEWTNAGYYRWRKDVQFTGRVPNWVFPWVWLILKGFIIVSWILHVTDEYNGRLATISTGVVTATWVMLLVTELLRKLWTLLAADLNRRGLALVDAILLVCSAVSVIVLLSIGINDANRSTGIISVVFYSCYVAWLLVALYYNIMHVYLNQDMVKVTPENPYVGWRKSSILPSRRRARSSNAYRAFPETL